MYLTSETRIDKKGREYFFVKNTHSDDSVMSATVFPAPSDPDNYFTIYIWWQKKEYSYSDEARSVSPFVDNADQPTVKVRKWVKRYLYMKVSEDEFGSRHMCVTGHHALHVCDNIMSAVRYGSYGVRNFIEYTSHEDEMF